MRLPLTVLTAVMALGAQAAEIDASLFFKQLAGKYTIKKVDGKAPKSADLAEASVDLDDAEAVMTFPYCPQGSDSCDLGAAFFDLKTGATKVDRSEPSPGITLFLLSTDSGFGDERYQWEVADSTIKFRKLNYVFNGGAPFELVYEVSQKPVVTRVDAITFLKGLVGNYEISTVAGKAPKSDDLKHASVEYDADYKEFIFTFPYCPEGSEVCDLGTEFIPEGDVTVTKSEYAGGRVVHRIDAQLNGTALSYEWETQAQGGILFRKLEYVFNGGAPFALGYSIKKL